MDRTQRKGGAGITPSAALRYGERVTGAFFGGSREGSQRSRSRVGQMKEKVTVPSRLHHHHHPTPNSHKDARERRCNTQTLLTPIHTGTNTHTNTHARTQASQAQARVAITLRIRVGGASDCLTALNQAPAPPARQPQYQFGTLQTPRATSLGMSERT